MMCVLVYVVINFRFIGAACVLCARHKESKGWHLAQLGLVLLRRLVSRLGPALCFLPCDRAIEEVLMPNEVQPRELKLLERLRSQLVYVPLNRCTRTSLSRLAALYDQNPGKIRDLPKMALATART